MTPHIYYTVITRRNYFLVKYAFVPDCKVFTFPGTFDTVLSAEEQFKQAMQGRLLKLSEGAFVRKIEDLSERHRQDLAKLADWNIGRSIRM
jgi:hypothetical protein